MKKKADIYAGGPFLSPPSFGVRSWEIITLPREIGCENQPEKWFS